MEIGGTYPMLYAFFGEDGALRRDAVTRQIGASLASGAAGIRQDRSDGPSERCEVSLAQGFLRPAMSKSR